RPAAEAHEGPAEKRIVDRYDDTRRGAGAGELLDDNHVGHRVEARATIGLRDHHPGEVHFRATTVVVDRELARAVERGCAGPDHLLGERPDRVADHLLVLGQPELEGHRQASSSIRPNRPSARRKSTATGCESPLRNMTPPRPWPPGSTCAPSPPPWPAGGAFRVSGSRGHPGSRPGIARACRASSP